MAKSMQASAAVMGAMNKQMDAAGVAQMAQQFSRQTAEMDMKAEVMDDALDAMFDDDDMQAETDDVVESVCCAHCRTHAPQRHSRRDRR